MTKDTHNERPPAVSQRGQVWHHVIGMRETTSAWRSS